jgi:hypothetical protein
MASYSMPSTAQLRIQRQIDTQRRIDAGPAWIAELLENGTHYFDRDRDIRGTEAFAAYTTASETFERKKYDALECHDCTRYWAFLLRGGHCTKSWHDDQVRALQFSNFAKWILHRQSNTHYRTYRRAVEWNAPHADSKEQPSYMVNQDRVETIQVAAVAAGVPAGDVFMA